MSNTFSMGIKINGEKEFKKVLAEYSKWSKKQASEIINAKLYFIALNAMQTTKTADKQKISNDLMAPSNINPEVPLVSILVNKQLKAKGKKGLTGQKMAQAMDKFIKRAMSRTQFLRSGYISILKNLDYWNRKGDISFVKRFAPKKPQGIKQYGKDKGEVLAARPSNSTRSYGFIWNKVGKDKQASSTVDGILEAGLAKAVRIELQSMNRHIEQKIQAFFKTETNKDTYK